MKFKNTTGRISRIGILFLGGILAIHAQASPTRVGNGDDGNDLEGAVKIESGAIWNARLKAVERLKSLHVQGIAGLGYLIPEVEKTELLMAKKDIAPLSHEVGSEISKDGRLVYARTFAEPHAETRFFPGALQLNEEQLISLHIHEALHRSLPEAQRESEEVVTEITLAINTPGANYDRIQRVADSWLRTNSGSRRSVSMVAQSKASSPKTASPQKSEISYSYQQFDFGNKNGFYHSSLHIIGGQKSFLEETSHSLALGLRLSADASERRWSKSKSFDLGPTEISGDIVLSEGENSQMKFFASDVISGGKYWGAERDVQTLGLNSKSENFRSLFESYVKYTLPAKAKQLGCISDCEIQYKNLWSLGGRAGYKTSSWVFAGVLDFHISDGWESSGDSDESTYSKSSTGRFSLMTVGPEITWKFKSGRVSLFGKEVVADSSGHNMNDLGDPLGRGDGARTYGTTLSIDM